MRRYSRRPRWRDGAAPRRSPRPYYSSSRQISSPANLSGSTAAVISFENLFGLTPNFLRDFNHQLELGALVRRRDAIAGRSARKSALRANRELVKSDESGGLVDSALERILRFELGKFARDQSEHDGLVFRHQPQRLETSGTRRVIFQKIRVDIDLIEQGVSHEVVATL